jgi:hypothetical protein
MTKETNNQATSVSSRRQDVIIVPLYFLLGFFPNGFGIWEGVVKLLFFFVEARHIPPRGRPKQRKREKEKEKKKESRRVAVSALKPLRQNSMMNVSPNVSLEIQETMPCTDDPDSRHQMQMPGRQTQWTCK